MTRFRCIPIETETAHRFRRTGRDDRGNTLRRVTATPGGLFPCRHCLRHAKPDEPMLLGSYDLPRPLGIYWTPSPIFMHEEACERFASDDAVAPIIRDNPLVSVRAYDAVDLCLYDLGHVGPGDTVDAPLQRALADRRTVFINVHTARPGCLLSRIQPVARTGA
jgi:hypothetical protein